MAGSCCNAFSNTQDHDLAPKASLASPRVFLGLSHGDIDDSLRVLHDHLRRIMTPVPKDFPWVAYDIWGTEAKGVEEDHPGRDPLCRGAGGRGVLYRCRLVRRVVQERIGRLVDRGGQLRQGGPRQVPRRFGDDLEEGPRRRHEVRPVVRPAGGRLPPGRHGDSAGLCGPARRQGHHFALQQLGADHADLPGRSQGGGASRRR